MNYYLFFLFQILFRSCGDGGEVEAVGGGEKGAAERLGERSVKLNCLSVCLSVSDSVCLSACLSVCMLNVFLMNQLGFKLISNLTRQVHITFCQIFFFFLLQF